MRPSSPSSLSEHEVDAHEGLTPPDALQEQLDTALRVARPLFVLFSPNGFISFCKDRGIRTDPLPGARAVVLEVYCSWEDADHNQHCWVPMLAGWTCPVCMHDEALDSAF